MKTPTLTEFKAWAKVNKPLALKLAKAMAVAELTRAQVDAYIQPIFEKYQFKVDADVAKGCGDYGTPLKSPKDLYLTDDPRLSEYYAECDDAHRAHGYELPAGYCPALVAETNQTKAEHDLIVSGAALMGIDTDRVIYGEMRSRMLDLLMGACLNGK